MTKRFNDQLLQEFTQNFYGYGNYNGKYWFIGMEEGGGKKFQELENRLTAWDKRGKRELEDVAEYHAEIEMTHFFNERPKLQTTWSKLIRILLSIEGQRATTNQVRDYQRSSLARSNANHCLLELLPLPSPRTGDWLYTRYSRLAYLATRESYKQSCLAPRVAHLKRRIKKYEPKVIIFYSFSYRQHWQEIASVDFSLNESDGVYIGYNEPSVFIVTKHPCARGVTNEYFHRVGEIALAKIAEH